MKKTELNLTSINYCTDSSVLFEPFAHEPYAIFLDSCFPHSNQGRFDVIAAAPKTVIETFSDHSLIKSNGNVLKSTVDPFELTQIHLQKIKARLSQLTLPAEVTHLPFTAGMLGYFGYDLTRRIEKLPEKTTCDIQLPEAVVGYYEWSIVVDHHLQQSWLISLDPEIHQHLQIKLNNATKPHTAFKITQKFKSNISRDQYHQAFEQLQKHILQGDCYEANLCQRFSGAFSGSPWAAFKTLRQKNPAPFAAFMNLPKGAILSLSPERFLQVKNNQVETKPIKGTSPRFQDAVRDQESAITLQNSEKDKAENLMIVDLLRNDLGKCCKPGSIKVPKLFALESFSNVHHLVSTVTGELEDHVHPIELLHACFPGGSITGAPKVRAMEIIEDLETHRRSVYCGTIGFCDVRGHMDCNIVIRTLICDGQQIHCYAGGAIVSDSTADEEYEETLIKVGKLIGILEGL